MNIRVSMGDWDFSSKLDNFVNSLSKNGGGAAGPPSSVAPAMCIIYKKHYYFFINFTN